jgi:pimeloyl-ACP methyl ester carboxylesterase
MNPIVFLHGVGTGAKAWTPQIEYFWPHYEVVAPDLPGFGENQGEFSFARALSDLEVVVHDVNRRVIVVGLSLGALVALRFALSHSETVAGLVTVAGFASLPEEIRVQQRGLAEELERMPSDAGAAVSEQLCAQVPEIYRDDARKALRGFTPLGFAQLFREVAEFDVRDQCAPFKKPTLVVWGDDDALNAPLCRDLSERLVNATTRTIPTAGHVVNLDAPDAFNAVLEEFFSTL